MHTHDQQTAEYVSAVGGSPALTARVDRMGKRIAELEAQVIRLRTRIVDATSIEFPDLADAPSYLTGEEASAWCSGYSAALRDVGRSLVES